MTVAWNRLRKDCVDFFRQIYVGEDRVLVFGEGDERAALMLVGEAPGEKEALAGRPFVGKAGEQLTNFLNIFEMKREDLYITNAVKFRPTRVSAAGRIVNRAPTQEEIALWRPWLQKEIELIKPRLIITMGNTALRTVSGAQMMIGDVHGKLVEGTAPPIFALYHPASVIYRKALHDTYLSDLKQLKTEVERIAI